MPLVRFRLLKYSYKTKNLYKIYNISSPYLLFDYDFLNMKYKQFLSHLAFWSLDLTKEKFSLFSSILKQSFTSNGQKSSNHF